MTKFVSTPLICGLALLGALSAAHAQTSIPALPPIAQPLPVPAPTPAPQEPTPVPQTPVPQVQPPQKQPPQKPVTPRPAPSRAPLLIQVRANVPALVAGEKTTVPVLKTLTIPAERAIQLRQRGEVSASLQADLDTFLNSLAAARDAHFEQQDDGQWIVVQANGLKVDAQATRAAVQKALRDPRGVTANVVVTGQTAPQRTLDFFASRGITTFLTPLVNCID